MATEPGDVTVDDMGCRYWSICSDDTEHGGTISISGDEGFAQFVEPKLKDVVLIDLTADGYVRGIEIVGWGPEPRQQHRVIAVVRRLLRL